jgi:hypothetical protein
MSRAPWVDDGYWYASGDGQISSSVLSTDPDTQWFHQLVSGCEQLFPTSAAHPSSLVALPNMAV